jgi:hypothetical protein
MSVPSPAGSPSLTEKLQRIDRRILYLILFVVIAVPTIWPMTIPNTVLPMSEALWNTIESTPKNKAVLISSTWTRSTRGENKGQMVALLNHLMSRRIRFILSSFDAQGTQVALDTVNEVAPKYHYVYGTDWIQWPFQANAANFVKGINVDFINTVKTDGVRKEPLQNFPIMQAIRSMDDIYIVVEISASASHMVWIQFLKPGVKVGFCPTSVMAPESLPYYAAGQLAGVLWGAKGAYDYEQLNVQHGTGTYSTGRQYMGPLSAAFGLVILSIVVGNIAMYVSRRRPAGGGA